MKKISEMTDQELLELRQEQIEKMVDEICMAEGIPLPLNMELPPEPIVPPLEKDQVYYEIDGNKFLDEAEANKLKEVMLQFKTIINTYYHNERIDNHYEEYIVKFSEYDTPDFAVRARKASTKEKYAEWLVKYKAYKRELDLYNEIKSKTSDIKEQRKPFYDEIETAIYEANRRKQKKETAEAIFAKYLEASNGDHESAKKFFMLAYSDYAAILFN